LESRPILGDLKTHPANETIGTAIVLETMATFTKSQRLVSTLRRLDNTFKFT